MSDHLECPLCAAEIIVESPQQALVINSSPDMPWSPDLINSPRLIECSCGKTMWSSVVGWFVKFETIRNLKATLLQTDTNLVHRLMEHLTSIIPAEMKVLDVSMDKTIVRLFCPNDKCSEKGFLTRTKAAAEKNAHFCDTCKHTLQWNA